MEDRRKAITRWLWAAIPAMLLTSDVAAQTPAPPADPVVPGVPSAPAALTAPAAPAGPVCTRRGHLHRMFHHTAHTLQDDFIGYPEAFVEPPLGSYVNRQFAVQVSKADSHRFTVYHTDFLPGTDRFSPVGASRFNLMYGRLAAWPGPIFVEWTPDQPELAEARRRAVLATLAAAGSALPAERVVIGPSPYPGAIGTEATGNFNNMVGRSLSASPVYPLPPIFSASMGVR
jgi:hypothetical protein